MDDYLDTPECASLYSDAIRLYETTVIQHGSIVHVNGIDMGYLEFGESDGLPLIWAHGSSSTGFEILSVQAGLVALGYRVIAIDYRGHGKTQLEIAGDNTSVYHVADDIAALLNYLQISKAVIGGLSKGGWIATAFYDDYPEYVLGLLLEDGGSFSNVRLTDDIQTGVIEPGPMPYSIAHVKRLLTCRFSNRFDAFSTAWLAYSPAVKACFTKEYMTLLISMFRQDQDGQWVHHCDGLKLLGFMEGDNPVPYSRKPIMQRSQELMIPSIIFRNLNIPVHIIDPVSPDDWMPVEKQNMELYKMHPDYITHECYRYNHSPHEAHIERPHRFIRSAKILMSKVQQAK